jgi:ferredoxin-NADP reductase
MPTAISPAITHARQSSGPRLGALVSPSLFDFWASRINPAWSWSRPRARIVARQPASSDSVTLWLAPNRHCPRIEPGQHVSVSAEVDGALVTRSYSPSSVAARRDRIAITVKRIVGGRLSQHLCDASQVGDVLDLGPGFGAFALPPLEAPPHPLLFLAAGSGITPLMAMARALAGQGMPRPLTLAYWCRNRDQLCFVDELRALASAHPQFQVRFMLTGDAAQGVDEGQGRISSDWFESLSAPVRSAHVLACGGSDFVATAEQLTHGRSASFVGEAFTAPSHVNDEEGEVEVTLSRSGRTLRVPRGESLLVALEAAGLRPAHGCRMGICNTCACAKTSGVSRHLPSGATCADSASALKLCINSAVSDLSLAL